ncbi:hypothetical protein M5689_006548 [Euphorbia peplus]|nr:hypothetical protein M5689_006548 [Euphorbia peplus]
MGHVFNDCKLERTLNEDGEWAYDASLRATPSKLRVVKGCVTKKAFPGGPRAGDWRSISSKPTTARKLFEDEGDDGLGQTIGMENGETVETSSKDGREDSSGMNNEGREDVNVEGVLNGGATEMNMQASPINSEICLNPTQTQSRGRKVHLKRLARDGMVGESGNLKGKTRNFCWCALVLGIVIC